MEGIIIDVREVSSADWRGALKELAEYALSKGYVKPSYINALLEREEKYPTGIEIPNAVNVAIPHAEVEHVYRQALIIAYGEKPVRFRNIEDPDSIVDVDVILLLIISNPDGYVQFLSKLTLLFQDEEFIRLAKSHRYRELGKLVAEKCL